MAANYNQILYVLLLPLFGAIFQALFGKALVDALGVKLGRRVSGTLAVLPIALAFLIGVQLTQALAALPPDQRHIQIQFADWISLLSIKIPFEVVVDPLSMTMVLVITGVGALIHLYATGYMAEEPDYPRFFTYLNLFIACMLILVLGGNLALLFIGWEGVGLCSYLLIGFWYKDLANAKAANKAFITNRVGDWGLSLGMFLLVAELGAHAKELGITDGRFLSYDNIIPHAVNLLQGQPAVATAIALLFFVGAMGKSAQFPLYLWLPDAMAGPTPVSALIHAATMVTSGVVLLNRLHILFELSPVASAVVVAIGAFTALFAALIAFGQTDIKKVLAYSTVSQLGYMFIGCGAGVYWAGMFHVTTHAFFKALLFLGSGAVIHAMAHNQDMRNYGKLAKYIPITCVTMMVGWFAICAIPFTFISSGAFSKEAILGGALANNHAMIGDVNVGRFAGYAGLFGGFLTAFYMTRMTWLTFFGNKERWKEIPVAHHEEHHEDHGHHGEAHADHHHGTDVHGFFYTDEEMAVIEAEKPHEHHHALDGSHVPHEVPPSMWLPLAVLAMLAAGGGIYLDSGERFKLWLQPDKLPVIGELSTEPHNLPLPLTMISLIAGGLGILLGLAFYYKGLPDKEGWDLKKWSPFRRAAKEQFGFDNAAMSIAVDGGGDLSRAAWQVVDVHGIDGVVNDAGYLAGALGALLRKLQTGFIRSYALVMLIGGILLLSTLTLYMYGLPGGSR
ncbi:MAG: NADH-quinone oxidoreductase subunit L [Armatimonadetes bacterium]|nr:NADH-quinone oxidoreductase subunit L [Armatimonadota bacterium]